MARWIDQRTACWRVVVARVVVARVVVLSGLGLSENEFSNLLTASALLAALQHFQSRYVGAIRVVSVEGSY